MTRPATVSRPGSDGTRIVFTSNRRGTPDIFVMAADGAGVTRITTSPAFDFAPDWGPEPRALPACTAVGTAGDDALRGTGGDDVLCGLGGDDTLEGLGGDDLILGGPGRDELVGGPGDDRVRGGPSADTLRGGAGADVLNGGPGPDSCAPGPGRDSRVSCERGPR